MKILFDTNVVLDVLLDRAPFSEVATVLFASVERAELAGYLCATTITTVHYLATKAVGAKEARRAIGKLLSLFEVAPVNRIVLEMALGSRFADFEDAVLHEAARHVGAEGVVTRNADDFKHAQLQIYKPYELSKIIQSL